MLARTEAFRSTAPAAGAAPVANNWQPANSGTATTLTLSNYVVSAGSNLLLVVGTAAMDLSGTAGNTQPTSVTWGGVSLTKIAGVSCTQESGNEEGATLWGLVNPTPGTGNIVATWAENQTTGCHLYAVYLTEAEQVLPTTLISQVSSTTDAASFTHTINSVPDDSLVLDSCAHRGPGSASNTYSTTQTDQIERVEQNSGASFHFGSERTVGAGANITLGWSATGGNWGRRADVAAAFKKAA